jgi:hypothetical protein
LYFCTSKASKVRGVGCAGAPQRGLGVSILKQVQYACLRARHTALLLLRQYLYFCTSKASKVCVLEGKAHSPPALLLLRQYLHFCTSTFVLIKQVKCAEWGCAGAPQRGLGSFCTIFVLFVLVKRVKSVREARCARAPRTGPGSSTASARIYSYFCTGKASKVSTWSSLCLSSPDRSRFIRRSCTAWGVHIPK